MFHNLANSPNFFDARELWMLIIIDSLVCFTQMALESMLSSKRLLTLLQELLLFLYGLD
jgi:hypothetical protein